MRAPHGSEQPPSATEARELSSRAFRAKRSTSSTAEAQLPQLPDAAVAAGWAGPPGVVARVHRALQLIDVAHEIAFAALERLLELLELGAPALDSILAELDVRLELGLALLQLALPLSQLEDARVHDLVGERGRRRRRQRGREPCAEQRSDGIRLLRRNLYAKDEWLRGSE